MLQLDIYNLVIHLGMIYIILIPAAQFCFIGFLIFFAVKTKSKGVIIIIISCILYQVIHLGMIYIMVARDILSIRVIYVINIIIYILLIVFITLGLCLCYFEWKNGKFQFKR